MVGVDLLWKLGYLKDLKHCRAMLFIVRAVHTASADRQPYVRSVQKFQIITGSSPCPFETWTCTPWRSHTPTLGCTHGSEQNRSVQMFKVTTSGLPACTQPPTFSRRRHMPVAYWKDNFRVHVSIGSAETLVRRGGIINQHSIAYSLSNISAKNYLNRLMWVESIVCNISVVFSVVFFFETQCSIVTNILPRSSRVPVIQSASMPSRRWNWACEKTNMEPRCNSLQPTPVPTTTHNTGQFTTLLASDFIRY